MAKFVTRAGIKSMSKRAKWILHPISVLAFANFTAFWVVAVNIGGDAPNGYEKSQHYFICAHGACREVSQVFWRHSY